ncbi:MAG: alpha/beta hydrolase [Candidatus Accumulibacter sp.]|jgi:pimeloyl-ACP methyl ester carboxylesterase|nr:alpha/beta hydrolase [Accumulibacter sp.]
MKKDTSNRNQLHPFYSEFVPIRGRRYHIRLWGSDDAPAIFFLHGWGDTSASFQFTVDALEHDWRIIAPDWRGFGESQWNDGGPYYFQDYIADLDALLERYSPDTPARIAGHSMGGIVAGIYAGIRPERVARFVNIEGFILWTATPEESPERFEKWLEQLREDTAAFRVYDNREAFAERLMTKNPRLTPERACFLSKHVLRTLDGEGGFTFAGDPRHRWIAPLLHPLPETMACWQRSQAQTLWIAGSDSPVTKLFAKRPEDYQERIACLTHVKDALIEGSGHNIHHDRPEQLARLCEDFFLSELPP